ncbi:MAG: hypothetical protein IJS15_05270, partial [Victivallales bacterium]|nr:hypothetical protein [Victivallales bacterium]
MDDELNPVFFKAHGRRRRHLGILGLVEWYERLLRKRLSRRLASFLPRCGGVMPQQLIAIEAPFRRASRQPLVQAAFRVAAASRGRQAASAAQDASRGWSAAAQRQAKPMDSRT